MYVCLPLLLNIPIFWLDTMSKKIIIDANFPSETRVVLLDKNNNIENKNKCWTYEKVTY